MHPNRKAAAAVEAKHYAGPQCSRCGSTTRYVVSGGCVDCTKRRATERQRKALEERLCRPKQN